MAVKLSHKQHNVMNEKSEEEMTIRIHKSWLREVQSLLLSE
jgi:hypothetical protein